MFCFCCSCCLSAPNVTMNQRHNVTVKQWNTCFIAMHSVVSPPPPQHHHHHHHHHVLLNGERQYYLDNVYLTAKCWLFSFLPNLRYSHGRIPDWHGVKRTTGILPLSQYKWSHCGRPRLQSTICESTSLLNWFPQSIVSIWSYFLEAYHS